MKQKKITHEQIRILKRIAADTEPHDDSDAIDCLTSLTRPGLWDSRSLRVSISKYLLAITYRQSAELRVQETAIDLIGDPLVNLLIIRHYAGSIELFAEWRDIIDEWEADHDGIPPTGEEINWILGEHHHMPPVELVQRMIDGEKFEDLYNVAA